MKPIKKFCSLTLAAAITMCMAGALTAGAVDVNTTIDINSSEVNSFVSVSDFPIGDMEEGGKLRITYSASNSAVQAHPVLNPGWMQITGATVNTVDGKTDTYYQDYNYSTIAEKMAEKEVEVSAINGVLVETWGLWDNETKGNISCPVTVKSVEWIASETPSEEPSEEPSEAPSEDYVAIDADDTNDIPAYTSDYTVPASGSDIVSGGKLRVEYTTESGTVPVLALHGTGMGHNWVGVYYSWSEEAGYGDRDKNMGTLENGHSYIDYPYDMLVSAYGDDFSDYVGVKVQVWSGDAKIYGVTWIEPETITAEKVGDRVNSGDGYVADTYKFSVSAGSSVIVRVTMSGKPEAELTSGTLQGEAVFGLIVATDKGESELDSAGTPIITIQ